MLPFGWLRVIVLGRRSESSSRRKLKQPWNCLKERVSSWKGVGFDCEAIPSLFYHMVDTLYAWDDRSSSIDSMRTSVKVWGVVGWWNRGSWPDYIFGCHFFNHSACYYLYPCAALFEDVKCKTEGIWPLLWRTQILRRTFYHHFNPSGPFSGANGLIHLSSLDHARILVSALLQMVAL